MIFYIIFRKRLIATENNKFYEENNDVAIILSLPKNIDIYHAFSQIIPASPNKNWFSITTSLWKIRISKKYPFIKFERIYQPDQNVITKIQSYVQAIN